MRLVTGLTCAALVLSAALCMASWSPLLAQPATGMIAGTASVVDGDTLDIHGTRIRLAGIDAPESAQQCRDNVGTIYLCGSKAALALDEFIARRPAECSPERKDRDGRTIARCEVGGIDLAVWLVEQGHALDFPRYSKGKYAQAEQTARSEGRGLWAGKFVPPWDFRKCLHTLGGRAAQCSGIQ
jgi:endonuclease YncB( thermonuclease family)